MKSAILLAALLPTAAFAQANQCAIPASIPRPHADEPTDDQPRRVVPIASYTLALSWSPEYCRTRATSARDAIQCGRRGAYGFTLHGLWPDGRGKAWPQYCQPAALLPDKVIRDALCATPSPQLLQHEYAKHGTCMTPDPARYFAVSNGLYRALKFPDMNALSRRPLTVRGLSQEIARVNTGLQASMMRVTVNKNGWLDELWLCLDMRFKPKRCVAGGGGEAPTARIKIWRG